MQKILTLDYHGVVDKDPKFFSKLMRNWQHSGGEVHLVSGLGIKKLLDVAYRFQRKHGVVFNQLFSIETKLIALGKPYVIRKGDYWFDDEDWNSSKGEYCESVGSTLHFDDSPEYEPYFTTPFVLWG